ncbi:hypothetical protein ACO0RG_000197 [Hanseniaspora osmophila]
MKLYLNTKVRQIALVANDYALVFKTTNTSSTKSGQNKSNTRGLNNEGSSDETSQAGEKSKSEDENGSHLASKKSVVVESFHFKELKSRGFKLVETLLFEGFLGLVNVGEQIFLGLIEASQQAAHPRWTWDNERHLIQPIEAINQIVSVSFVCLTSNRYDDQLFDPAGLNHARTSNSFDRLYTNVNYAGHPNGSNLGEEGSNYNNYASHPCAELKKLFCDGTFYFSREFDLTNNLQERGIISSMDYIIEKFDEKYVWNINMIHEMIQFRSRISSQEKEYLDKGKFITFVIRGFCKSKISELQLANPTCVTIITKISTENKRHLLAVGGIDNEGNVSNFCESEVILSTESHIFSYVICYGNVPLSWEMQESQILHSKKIKLSKSPEYTQASFDKHFDRLATKYGIVSIVNLVKPKSHSQAALASAYQKCAESKGIRFTNIEYSSDVLTRFTHKLLYHMKEDILDFGALVYDIERGIYCGKQTGVIRISAFNSLKRPFLVEKSVSQEVIEMAVEELGAFQIPADFSHMYEKVWKEQIFFMNKLYEENFKHRDRYQKVYRSLFSLKVTLYDPLHSYIVNYLRKRKKEFLYDRTIKIFSGTFNVGGTLYKGDISSWLFPKEHLKTNSPDIYVIGLEEVVELTPGQMLSTDTLVKPFWENHVLKTLNEHSKSKRYVYLWGLQLGGILMMVFISEPEYSNVKKLEGDFTKLGFGGISANKGAVAVRFVFSTTKFCFIASHLAAGLQNVEQRHNDYKTVNKNICFAKGVTIKDHDGVIWMGDFNYRLLLSNEEARAMIKEKRFEQMFEMDQLNQQMISGESFPYYNEMEINFPPTYKFDPGTKSYDTSEKNRIPAWTDRVLNRGDILTQLEYGCCENIVFSDHRPVYAVFNADVTLANEPLKMKLANEIYQTLQKELIDLDIQEKFDVLQAAEDVVSSAANKKAAFIDKDLSMASVNKANRLGYEYESIDANNATFAKNNNSGSTRSSNAGMGDNLVPCGKGLNIKSYTGNTKLAPPSTDKNKWWIGDGKQATIILDINPKDYMINPHRSTNPFELDSSEPFFAPRVENEDELEPVPEHESAQIKPNSGLPSSVPKNLQDLAVQNSVAEKGKLDSTLKGADTGKLKTEDTPQEL